MEVEGKKKSFFKYSEEDLKSAIIEVREKNGRIRETARKYNIPHSTLINKLKGKTPELRKMGPPTILTPSEELLLCNWINANAKKGFPLDKRMLLETVQEIISADGRPNPFHENKPGDTWFKAFLKRHPQISERHAESINLGRALVNEASIRKWHSDLQNYLNSENAQDILNEPRRIFNADESGFLTNPETGLVLAPKGMGNFYSINTGSEKESITVLVTVNADGKLYPPMIVYPYERIPSAIVKNLNQNWPVGRSKTGWMTGQTFYGYLANTFLPLLKEENIKFPVLFLIDGHRSHLSYATSKFCSENQIILYSLLPNATHILQPADVSVFRPLKVNWRATIADWKKKTGNLSVTRVLFGPLFESCLDSITPYIIKNGFRKCGLFPFNVQAVDFTKCMSDKSRVYETSGEIQVKPTSFNVEHLLFIESLMPSGRAEEFRRSEKTGWKGPESAKELFDMWIKLRQRLMPAIQGNATDEENGLSNLRSTNDEIGQNISNDRNEDNARSEVSPKNKEMNNETNLSCTDSVLHNASTSLTPVQSTSKVCVSPAFLNHIIWPTESPKKCSKRKRERLPHAASSKAWLTYWENKENDKLKKEEEKKKKKEEREQSKKIKQINSNGKKINQPKQNPDEDWICKVCEELDG